MSLLQRQRLRLHPVEGRAGRAVEEIQRHPEEVVVIDSDATDISINQAVRQIGRLLPNSLVFTVHPQRKIATVYQTGRRVGEVNGTNIVHFAETPTCCICH